MKFSDAVPLNEHPNITALWDVALTRANQREIKMFRRANLFMLSLFLLCSAPAAYAEDGAAVAEGVKSVVKERAPCWKLFRQQERKNVEFPEVEQDWVCGKESVIVYVYQAPSAAAAAKLLYEIVTSPVQSSAVALGAPRVDYRFGDESYVRAYMLYTRSSYVFFRTGNIVVRIDSNGNASKRTLRNAVLFARLFAERMAPPDNSSKPPAR